jgi:RNase P subunit RPR2
MKEAMSECFHCNTQLGLGEICIVKIQQPSFDVEYRVCFQCGKRFKTWVEDTLTINKEIEK